MSSTPIAYFVCTGKPQTITIEGRCDIVLFQPFLAGQGGGGKSGHHCCVSMVKEGLELSTRENQRTGRMLRLIKM